MHIPDSILQLSPAVLVGGYAVTAATTAYALYRINREEDPRELIPRAALLTAAFFVASRISIPLPPVTVHLVLNGLLGVILGWYAAPSILIGLILQALIFQHGGVTTLGVNFVIMGVPSLLAFGVFQFVRARPQLPRGWLALWSFLAGGIGVLLSAAIFYVVVLSSNSLAVDPVAERNITIIFVLSHVPVAIIEGLLTVYLVTYLRRVRPEFLPYVGQSS